MIAPAEQRMKQWIASAVLNRNWHHEFSTSPCRMLCIDGFLRAEPAQRLAQILERDTTFAPRFGARQSSLETPLNGRAALLSAAEWVQIPNQQRLFRFDAMESIDGSVSSLAARLTLLGFYRALTDTSFLAWLQQLSGISCGAGVLEAHAMSASHFIKPHSDAREGRGLGVFIYLTREWQEEDGGELRLTHGQEETVVAPLFNRAVIFDVAGHRSHCIDPLPPRCRRRLSFGVWFHRE